MANSHFFSIGFCCIGSWVSSLKRDPHDKTPTNGFVPQQSQLICTARSALGCDSELMISEEKTEELDCCTQVVPVPGTEWGTGGMKAEQVCRLVLRGMCIGLSFQDFVYGAFPKLLRRSIFSTPLLTRPLAFLPCQRRHASHSVISRP